jgi:hypothetical protein
MLNGRISAPDGHRHAPTYGFGGRRLNRCEGTFTQLSPAAKLAFTNVKSNWRLG